MKKIESNAKGSRIVCIGGGTGTFVTLKGLKKYHHQLSGIVTMSDSGGSNKRIRDEFGLLPTSDLRQCMVALSDENGGVGLLRKLFMYRFEKGEGISGMTFGNLFMAALADILGSQEKAIEESSKVLRIHGQVIPVSFTDTNLVAVYEDGHILNEEHLIDEPSHDGTMKITHVSLKPEAAANPKAAEAIVQADLVVLGPGDLYTSILPNILVSGIPEAIHFSKAKIIYVMNLMTKYGQTYGYTTGDHVRELERYLGENSIDSIIVNNAPVPKSAVEFYEHSHEYQIVDDLTQDVYHTVIRADVISTQTYKKSSTDALVRSLIRHDSDKLASVLVSLL